MSGATVCSTCGADNDGLHSSCAQCGRALPPAEIAPGYLLAERYEIEETLGAGGMGTVYKSHDRLLNEPVAIKVLRRDASQSPEAAARFISEIKLARAVSHRNVARIHEYGEHLGVRYLSMAFVDGVDLKRVLREQGPLAPGRALELALQAAEGLHAIHEEGILHRDLKCSNIMLDRHGVVRLMDFGLAKERSPQAPRDMTAAGEIVGTPEYMSPEQILGRPLDRSSDVYSLGVVLYELIAGRTPFRGDTPMATLLMHLNFAPSFEDPSLERLPPAIGAALRKALSKQPGERFVTALDFARALEQARGSLLGARDDSLPTVSLVSGAAARVTAAAQRRLPAGRWLRAAALAVVAAAGVVLFLFRAPLVGRPPAPSRLESAPPATAAKRAAPPPSLAAAPAAPPAPVLPSSERSIPSRTTRSGSARGVEKPAASASAAVRSPSSSGAAGERERSDAQVEALLADAGAALAAQRYDDAIALYDRVLALDPQQQMALIAKATATNAKSAARAAAAAPAPGSRAFVAGDTTWHGPDAGPERAYSEAFEAGGGIDARSDTQLRRPPGHLEFDARPRTLRAGERYTLQAYFANPGKAAVEIRDMFVTHLVNGRRSAGPVAPSTRTVAPGQRGLLLSISDFLEEGTESWSLEVRVTTVGGDTYKSELDWK